MEHDVAYRTCIKEIAKRFLVAFAMYMIGAAILRFMIDQSWAYSIPFGLAFSIIFLAFFALPSYRVAKHSHECVHRIESPKVFWLLCALFGSLMTLSIIAAVCVPLLNRQVI